MKTPKSLLPLIVGVLVGGLIAGVAVYFSSSPTTRPTVGQSSREKAQPAPQENRAPSPWIPLAPSRHMNGSCLLRGSVFGVDEKPVNGAIVRLRLLDEPWPSGNVDAFVKTNGKGEYKFEHLTQDASYQVFAWHPQMAVGSYDHAACGAITDIYLEHGCELSLTFIDEKGNPLPHVLVNFAGSALWPTRTAVSDASGKISLRGLSPGLISFMAFTNELSFTTLEPVELQEKDQIEMEVQLQSHKPVSVLVVDAVTKSPVENATIHLQPHNAFLLSNSTRTNSEGRASISGASLAVNDILVKHSSYLPYKSESVFAGDQIRVHLQMGARIEGTIQTAKGKFIEGAFVDARQLLNETTTPIPDGRERAFNRNKDTAALAGWPQAVALSDATWISGPSHIPVPTTTQTEDNTSSGWQASDKSGRFTIDGIPPGTISIGAIHNQYVVHRRPTVEVAAGATVTDIPIIMKDGVRLENRVTTKHGHPIENAIVTVFDQGGQILKTANTAADGYVTLVGLPEQFRLTAEATGFVAADRKFFGTPGNSISSTLRLMEADKAIKGQVVSPTGTGLSGCTIEARLVAQGQTQTIMSQSDTDGYFTLNNAGIGKYDVVVEHNGSTVAQSKAVDHTQYLKLVVDNPLQIPDEKSTITNLNAVPLSPAPTVIPRSSAPAVLKEPVQDFQDNHAGYVTGTSRSDNYGNIDELAVTGPPPGKGSLPIRLKRKGNSTIVAFVSPGSQVYAAGLRNGARLLKIDGKKVSGPAMANNSMEGKINSIIVLDVMQSGQPLSLVVQRVRVN